MSPARPRDDLQAVYRLRLAMGQRNSVTGSLSSRKALALLNRQRSPDPSLSSKLAIEKTKGLRRLAPLGNNYGGDRQCFLCGTSSNEIEIGIFLGRAIFWINSSRVFSASFLFDQRDPQATIILGPSVTLKEAKRPSSSGFRIKSPPQV